MKRTNQMTHDKLLVLMAKVPVFSGLNGSERSQIADHAHIYIAQQGEVIIEKEATDTCFYVLLSGCAKVLLDRKGKAIAYLEPGTVFGEIGFILHAPRTTWVLAERMTALLRVDQMLLNSLDHTAREKLKDQIIVKLAKMVEGFNASSLS